MSPSTQQNTPAKAGVLPISAVHQNQSRAQQQQQPNGVVVNNNRHAANAKYARAISTGNNKPQTNLKVVIRRLPPGLTEEEYKAATEEEWQVGNGKVSWYQFRPGKISKDISKPSKPARAYLQVTDQAHLESLSEKVRTTAFQDARNTSNDSALLGPPVLEFAPYGRIAALKKRNDQRQGLIDQDPEFIAFLESLTNPITKPPTLDSLDSGKKEEDEPPKVTPLIQHLRDKKAAKESAKEKDKEKDAKGKSKHTRQGSKNEKSAAEVKDAPATATQDKKSSRTAKVEKSPKVTAKQTKVDGASEPSKQQQQGSTTVKSPKGATTELAAKKAEPASPATAAARMIQRDLGIKGGRGGAKSRPAKQSPNADGTNDTNSKSTTPKSPQPTPVKPTPRSPSILKREATPGNNTTATTTTTNQPPGKPLSNPPIQPSTPTAAQTKSNSSETPSKSLPQVSPGAKRAFLKHANPSQGVTEALLLTTFQNFGSVTKCEIDKRKGFAYIDFGDTESLRKAISASPVAIGRGSVQVLERKEKYGSGAVGAAPSPAAAVAGVGSQGSTSGGANGNVNGNGNVPPTGPRNGVPPSGPTRGGFVGHGPSMGGYRGGGRGGGRGRGGGGLRGGAGFNNMNNNVNPSTTATTTTTSTNKRSTPAPAPAPENPSIQQTATTAVVDNEQPSGATEPASVSPSQTAPTTNEAAK